MEITNLTENTYQLPGMRLDPDGSLNITTEQYIADDRLRHEVNGLSRNHKISVVDAPEGFPIATAGEAEILSGEEWLGDTSGGSQPGASRWIGPFTIDAADYVADLGGGGGGVLFAPAAPLAVDDLFLGVAVVVDTDFLDSMAAEVPWLVSVGDPAIDSETFKGRGVTFLTASNFPGLASAYNDVGGIMRIIFGSDLAFGADWVVAETAVLSVWAGFDSVPVSGTGRVWLNVATPTAA